MSRAFCTISTYDHLHKVRALYHSIKRFDQAAKLHVLVVDQLPLSKKLRPERGIKFYKLQDVCQTEVSRRIVDKYASKPDALRWSLKPVFMQYLLQHHKLNGLIYTDNDIYFFGNYRFLFDMLIDHKVILTPHWRTRSPNVDAPEFETNFTDGVFNGGFVGANSQSISALQWWAEACAYKCEKTLSAGLWVDQKYFDLLHVLFTGIGVVRHQGCNVAYWNRRECQRTIHEGSVCINYRFPIIFIHFTQDFMDLMHAGGDPLLKPFLEEYEHILQQAQNPISTGGRLLDFFRNTAIWKRKSKK